MEVLISDDTILETQESIIDLLEQNKSIEDVVTTYKDKIEFYYENKSWDRFKRYGNEYENIFITQKSPLNISRYNAVSRAFFKLWEIMHDYKHLIFKNDEDIKCMFLCESPGGFTEAIIKYRRDKGFKNDEYTGISLKSDNKEIPEWKYDKYVNINYGFDNTGDLYNYRNITFLVDKLYPNSQDIITGDGGFDTSSNFNDQEGMSFHLILCEILSAIELQKKNGSFILKIFSMFNVNTLKLLQIVKEFYKEIRILKPKTSRPANSEKYLLCTCFRNDTEEHVIRKKGLQKLVKNYSNSNMEDYFKTVPFNNHILQQLVTYNQEFSLNQINYIDKIIEYIQEDDKENMKNIQQNNKKIAINWCKKYSI